MKILFLNLLIFLVCFTSVGQNTQTENKIKTVTIEDSEGIHKTVKTEVVKKDQKIELGKETTNSINIPTIDSPIFVTTTTKIINPDGTTRTVQLDRSGYYENKGRIYVLALDASGYRLTHGEMQPALLRKTSINSYIYTKGTKMAIAYFDNNENLVVEFYDELSNQMIIETYNHIKK
ncbi:MAG: hypothetical protein RI980_635 [Bacteroidota bacterium]|jgi:hypothetical protein